MVKALIPLPKKLEEYEGSQALPLCAYTEVAEWKQALDTLCVSVKKMFCKEMIRAEGGVRLLMDPSLPTDTYRIDTREGIVLSASSEEGIFYAIASLLQIIDIKNGEIVAAKLFIEDHPDKEYRTLMVDLAREWHPAWTVERYIDVCFLLKIRYLHLHFIDDERYTLPSHAFPKLSTEGEHYTFDEIAHMNRYAEERGIFLVPEFEAPGHAASMVECYPEIFADNLPGGDGHVLVTEEGTVISAKNIMCASKPETMEALGVLFDEICRMFPKTPYIHIGGDEANIKVWNSCPDCVAYMKANGIDDVYELYSDFTARVAQMVLDRGRTPIVWEGFPKKGANRIPRETIVIAWESHYHMADDLLAEGFKIINGSWQPLYITPGFNHGRWCARDIYEWDVYNLQHWWEHSAATVNPVHLPPTDRVIGAQITSWQCTYEMEICRIMETLAVLSERTWNLNRTLHFDLFQRVLRENNLRLGRLIQDR